MRGVLVTLRGTTRNITKVNTQYHITKPTTTTNSSSSNNNNI